MKRFSLLILFLAACATTTQSPNPQAVPPPVAHVSAQPVHIFVVGTTDRHGWYDSHHESRTAPAYGGLSLLGGYLQNLRSAHPGQVILVDSGDLFQGTLESNLFEGEPVVKGYNALGYAAAAVGNHEFDYGPVGPDSVARLAGEDPLGALKKNAANATFPFLSANLTEKATGKTPSWAKRYVLVNAGGAKVGIIGLSTPDTPKVTMASNVATLEFGDPVPATIRAANELRAAGADAVIVIAHMGGRCKNIDTNPADISTCETDQEAVRFLNAMPKGTIDGYFAGHTHSQMRHYINGVPALQPAPLGREFAMLDLTIDPATHSVTKSDLAPLTMVCAQVYEHTETCDPKKAPSRAALVPRSYEGAPVAELAGLSDSLKPYLQQVAARRNEEIGIRTTERIKRGYGTEFPLGDLFTDAMRAYMKTDIAVINSGGLRADLPAGSLIYANMFDVAPFDNFPAIVTMTGAQIRQMLDLTSIGGGRGILQVSGIRYTIDEALDADKPAAQRHRVVDVTLAGGKPLDPNASYRVAMLDFLVTGGEGLDVVMKQIPESMKSVDYSRPIRDLLISALKTMPQPIAPKTDGRITALHHKASED